MLPALVKYCKISEKKLQEITASADAIIQKMDTFSFDEFEKEYAGSKAIKIKKRKPEPQNPLIANEGYDYSPYQKRFAIFAEKHAGSTCLSCLFLSYIQTC